MTSPCFAIARQPFSLRDFRSFLAKACWLRHFAAPVDAKTLFAMLACLLLIVACTDRP
jgi:hypothetical protein